METDEMVCYDMHLRHTDENGRARVQCHRVWDGERFFSARLEEASRERKSNPKSKVDVQMITAEQYQKERAK